MPRPCRRAYLLVLCALTLGLCATLAAFAQGGGGPDAVMKDATLSPAEPAGSLSFFMWLPPEVILALVRSDPTVTPDVVQTLETMLSPYSIVAFCCGNTGADLQAKFIPPDEIVAHMNALDSMGNRHKPLAGAPPDEIAGLLGVIKMMLRDAMGTMGQHVGFALFSDKLPGGGRLGDPTRKGSFGLVIENVDGVSPKPLVWRLPLDSLLPPRLCPGCGEPMRHAWSYCPWCGKKLE